MRKSVMATRVVLLLIAGLTALWVTSGSLSAAVCTAPDNGSGTINLPADCDFFAQLDKMHIIDGLPAGTTIDIDPTLYGFSSVLRSPGGSLGGEIIKANANLHMLLSGTGGLSGFSRDIIMPVSIEYHTAPRIPGTSPQSFDCDLYTLQGQLPPGDPDFDLLRITAGTGFGMPSPGHTTLQRQSGTTWAVESFFDITYRIDFIGHPGSVIAGMSGSTTATIRLVQGGAFWSSGDAYKMHYPQLPDVTGWDVYGTYAAGLADDWKCTETGPVKDLHFWGSWLGGNRGNITAFNVGIYSDVPASPLGGYSRPGTLLWSHTISNFVETPFSPVGAVEGWYDPIAGFYLSGDHTQYFQYDILLDSLLWFPQTSGTIYWLAISAIVQDSASGRRWGWKSTLNHYNDDAVWRLAPIPLCVAPDNSTGTATLPADCDYTGHGGLMHIVDGLPPGTTIDMPPTFTTYSSKVELPGLDGHSFQSKLMLPMTGNGALFGFSRNVAIPTQIQIQTVPRIPGAPVQSFAADLYTLQGQLPPGDPDFDLLRITGGTGFGLPSPGHFTLALQPDGTWGVESFFDLTYRIDFIGHPGGAISGMSGSTTATIRIYQGGSTDTTWHELKEPPTFLPSLDLSFVITGGNPSCCVGTTGNVNMSGIVDLSDLSALVNYLTGGGYVLPCVPEANVNATGIVDLSDLSALVNYLTGGGYVLPFCP